MAENKKSFVAYCDWGAIFDELSNEEKGKLAQHLFDYVRDKNPKSDKMTSLMFIPIKQTLKRDLVVWEEKSEKRAEIGRKGGIASGKARASKSKQKQANEANGSKSKQTKQNEHGSVSVSVNDSGNVNDIKEKEKAFQIQLQSYQKTYSNDMLNSFYMYWSESNTNGKKMKFEMQKTWDLSKRLVTWNKNEAKFNGKSGKSGGASESELTELYTKLAEEERKQGESL